MHVLRCLFLLWRSASITAVVAVLCINKGCRVLFCWNKSGCDTEIDGSVFVTITDHPAHHQVVLISALQTWLPHQNVGLTIVGDSITDGRGSTSSSSKYTQQWY